MNKSLAVFNSNGVNRYGIAFTVRALESALEQSWNIGMPSFVSHDYHRPIAWSKGLSLFMEPGLVRLAGVVLNPSNKEDSQEIYRAVQYYLSNKTLEYFEQYKDELSARLGDLISENAQPHMPSCAAFIDEQLAVRRFPEIFSERDKDGLISISELTEKAPGIYEKDGLLVFAHPYFRRSLSRLNSLNTPFLEVLNKFDGKQAGARIALDPDMVGLASSFLPHIELEYWWGPRFDNDLSKIVPGVTRHNASERERLFHGISQTEFWWHMQDQQKTLECEELRDIPSYGTGIDSYGCRYVHSIIDNSTAHPFHLDGAIRLYTEEAMLDRVDKDIKGAGRHSQYTKLWRIDGSIDVSVWKDLLTHYFRDNPLVGEYLGAEEEVGVSPHIASEFVEENIFSKYIPYDCKKGDGPIISVSYQPMVDDVTSTRYVECFDSLLQDAVELRYVEDDFIEVCKLLRKEGESITMPSGVSFVAFDDYVHNFPLIQHTGENATALASQSLNAIKKLCECWANQNDDRVISYNIAIQYQHKNVCFSISGHVAELDRWHKNTCSSFPHNEKEISDWCANAEKYLTSSYPKTKPAPLFSILRTTGLIVIGRKILEPDGYRMRFDNKNNKLYCDLLVHKAEVELIELLRQGEVQTACASLVKGARCRSCNQSYLTCNCSKYLDEDVCEEMTDFKLLAPFWTNRKA